MATSIFNRVALSTATTGTGPITFGSPLGTDFLTPAEAGVVDTDTPWVLLQEGGDFQLFRGTVGGSVTTVARTSTIVSKIGGTVGTSDMDLQGAATLRFVEPSAAWLAENIPVSPSILSQDNVQDALEALETLETRLIGALLPYTGASEPSWGAFPDGASFNRADYPSWWDWIENSSGNLVSQGSKTAGNYGTGNGSTTFTVPNLAAANRYIRHADGSTLACGALQNDGAPNITGHCGPFLRSGASLAGALSHPNIATEAIKGATTGQLSTVSLDASASDSRYGAASEIRPITVAYPFVILHGGLGA